MEHRQIPSDSKEGVHKSKSMSILELGLREHLFAEETEESLRKKLVKSARAKNILENEDFKWWVENVVDRRVDTHTSALVWKDMEPREYHVTRGVVQGVMRVLQELRRDADSAESLERKLSEHDARNNPVARGA
jgi:hypothetical protein